MKDTRRYSGCAAFVAGVTSLAAIIPSPAQAQQAGGSCPLTVKQEVAAVKAFKRLAPIFREPRCLNCHGGVNPFVEDGGHEGGRIDVLEMTDNDQIRQSEKAFGAMREACNNCHIPGWTIPMRVNHFLNKSDQDLCMQMKRRLETASAFKFHMERDGDIKTGFAGSRGLTSPDPPTKKPKMTHPQMLNAAKAWTRAMGEKWHQPEDCGCKIHGLVLQIQHRIDTDPTDAGYRMGLVKYGGAVDFSVRLEPGPEMPDGWFSGKASVVRPISVYHPKCSGKSAPRPEDWEVKGIMDDEGTSMRFLFSIDFDKDPQGTLTCPHHSMELEAVILGRLTHRNDMHIPTTTGATAQFRSKEFDNREWLTVTILNGSESK